ncbi:MAG: N-6 DNA methylase [Phycisphaera sp.]|nr:N-6 DNA methylase [Phycisphaera sp.]
MHLTSQSVKANGAHYTPPALAAFLAEATARHATWDKGSIAILDPACGDGSLLAAIVEAAAPTVRRRLRLVGYETDATAATNASTRLQELAVAEVDIRIGDFLDMVTATQPVDGPSLFGPPHDNTEFFDAVISNPPYVRTQVLGAAKAQQLAERFGLSGRVDLYHAFVKAISSVLKPGGVLGLLTSNRFMLVQSGATVRELLRTEFSMRDLYDLGDTKLFTAAVLPAIVVAQRNPAPPSGTCCFTRVYLIRDGNGSKKPLQLARDSVLDALRNRHAGDFHAVEGYFRVEQGELDESRDLAAPWSLSSSDTRSWLSAIQKRRVTTFGEVAQVRVGIKTTADTVFIRDDWDSLPERIRPEPVLLRPLITHHIAARWRPDGNDRRRVLYPHEEGPGGERRTVDLSAYPRACAYLEEHRERLESRRYVIEAGRHWYEIWVPQQPRDWSSPKVVYPDISEEPRFFLDRTGAVVNGDCYWITLNAGISEEYLLLLLAVANSTFITSYYDTVFHNKLYAGRRRFMTQYVREFPLPDVRGPDAQRIVALLSNLPPQGPDLDEAATEMDALVWSSFGLKQKAVR